MRLRGTPLQAQKAEKEAAPKTEHSALKDRFKADLANYKKDSEAQFAASQERQAAAQLLAFKRQQQAAHHDFELKQLADVTGVASARADPPPCSRPLTLEPPPPRPARATTASSSQQMVSVLQAQKDQNKARRLRNLESETGMLLAQRKERHAILQTQQNETHKTELEQLDLQLKKEDKDLRKRHQAETKAQPKQMKTIRSSIQREMTDTVKVTKQRHSVMQKQLLESAPKEAAKRLLIEQRREFEAEMTRTNTDFERKVKARSSRARAFGPWAGSGRGWAQAAGGL